MRNRNFFPGDIKKYQERRQKNRVFFGIAMAIVGAALLLRAMGILPNFDLDLSWPVIMIIIGVLIGIKNSFRNSAWWILILIGLANITPQFMIMGKPSTHFIWPAAIILAGIAIAFKPKREPQCIPHRRMESTINNDSTLNIDVTFAGRKEIVTSKDFKGGVISATFAGCELNLNQADFTDPFIVIDCRVSFGGVEIILPSHWEVQNEINPSFGNIEDERTIHTTVASENKKLLILRGSCSFGNIEIKSY